MALQAVSARLVLFGAKTCKKSSSFENSQKSKVFAINDEQKKIGETG